MEIDKDYENENDYVTSDEKRMIGIQTTITLDKPFDILKSSTVWIWKDSKGGTCKFRRPITKELIEFLRKNEISITESIEHRPRGSTIIGGIRVRFVDDHTIQYISPNERDTKINYQSIIKSLKENGYKKVDRNCKKMFESEDDLHCEKILGIEDAWI